MEWTDSDSDDIVIPDMDFMFSVDDEGELTIKFSDASGEVVEEGGVTGVDGAYNGGGEAELQLKHVGEDEQPSWSELLLTPLSAQPLPFRLFDDSEPSFHCLPATRVPRTTHSRKRKHEHADGAAGAAAGYIPRPKRGRSTFSYKFATVEQEVQYRLHTVDGDKKSQKLNALLRTCYTRFHDGWMTWDDVKAVATEVGYSKTNNLFRCIWPLVVSRYGRNSETVQNCEVFGINFPYWVMDASVKYKRNERGKTRLQLAPEFFQPFVISV
jgi:hypothetical protein